MPKLAERLTDIKVKNAKPKEKLYKLAAGRGLHLLVKTDGSKHWQFRFRFEGKENTIAIGRYPEVTLANAEKKATSAIELIDGGINPSENKKAAKASKTGVLANSFEVVAREWAISYFTNKSASHKDRTVRRLESYIFPWLCVRDAIHNDPLPYAQMLGIDLQPQDYSKTNKSFVQIMTSKGKGKTKEPANAI